MKQKLEFAAPPSRRLWRFPSAATQCFAAIAVLFPLAAGTLAELESASADGSVRNCNAAAGLRPLEAVIQTRGLSGSTPIEFGPVDDERAEVLTVALFTLPDEEETLPASDRDACRTAALLSQPPVRGAEVHFGAIGLERTGTNLVAVGLGVFLFAAAQLLRTRRACEALGRSGL